jgi:hypothetical protein
MPETKPSKHASRTYIPGIGNDEGARTFVERAKVFCLFFLGKTHTFPRNGILSRDCLTERCEHHSAGRQGTRSTGQPSRDTGEP